MSAATEPCRQFTIPSAAELDAIVDRVFEADNAVQEIQLALLHATGRYPEPKAEFAKPPTLEDVGALYLFAHAVENYGENLKDWARDIRGVLASLKSLEGDDA